MEGSIEAEPRGIRSFIPILTWLPHYKSEWLRFDVIAGLTIFKDEVVGALGFSRLSYQAEKQA